MRASRAQLFLLSNSSACEDKCSWKWCSSSLSPRWPTLSEISRDFRMLERTNKEIKREREGSKPGNRETSRFSEWRYEATRIFKIVSHYSIFAVNLLKFPEFERAFLSERTRISRICIICITDVSRWLHHVRNARIVERPRIGFRIGDSSIATRLSREEKQDFPLWQLILHVRQRVFAPCDSAWASRTESDSEPNSFTCSSRPC